MNTATIRIPSEARPTVQEARPMLGLGRLAMYRYTDGLEKTSKLHPSDVMHIAFQAHQDKRKDVHSLYEVGSSLINHAMIEAPATLEAVEQMVNTFRADHLTCED